MSRLLTDWFHRLHEAPADGGGDGEMVSVQEAFGRSPEDLWTRTFGGEPEGDDDDASPPTPAADDDATPPADPDAEGADDDDEGDGEPAPAWQQEMEKRFAPGTFTEEGWKAYRNMEVAFSQRQPATPEPQKQEDPPPPAPRPLGGKIGEINSEEDLYSEAQLRPRETAMWALDNHERLTPEQYQNVMNLWFVSNPTEYIEFREQALMQAQEERFTERFSYETAAQVDNARAEGLAEAYEEMPLIKDYRPQLSAYMHANPHLNQWVDSLRTRHEVKSAVQSIFYMMAGPELARQAVAQQAQKALDEAAAAAGGEGAPPPTPPPDPAAATSTRRSAQPRATPGTRLSDEEYAKGIQDKILGMPTRL